MTTDTHSIASRALAQRETDARLAELQQDFYHLLKKRFVKTKHWRLCDLARECMRIRQDFPQFDSFTPAAFARFIARRQELTFQRVQRHLETIRAFLRLVIKLMQDERMPAECAVPHVRDAMRDMEIISISAMRQNLQHEFPVKKKKSIKMN